MNSLVVVINVNRLKEKYSIVSIIVVKVSQFQRAICIVNASLV